MLNMKRQNLILAICWLLVLLFVYAASSKLIAHDKFTVQLGQSPLLHPYAGWLSWLMPIAEIGIALALFNKRYRLIGLYLSFTLMTMFTAYIIAITQFSDYIPCSCGGILQKMTWNQHLVFNIFFTAITAIGVFLSEGSKIADGRQRKGKIQSVVGAF